ncbi:hypothetical protein EVAR_79264_1 [Eumeta japonica]|uniref:Uncharacterized protein n=1 Tax=Eumeta variegata TaxID=151549 RepID=A0A4C1THL2_EUMVA|nr:hypothetical protein EVAR_79264_1 [Eumeta japonica]
MVSVLQESAPSLYDGQNGLLISTRTESCEDDPLGASCDSDRGKCSKIEKLVLADRRIKLWQIAEEELQISKERVGEIIHEHMNIEKSVRKLGTKMLTPFDKQRRLPDKHEAVVQKRRGKLSRGCCFTRQCICPHGAGFEAGPGTRLLELTTHLQPRSGSSDYFLSNLKELRGRRFVDDNQMKMAVEAILTAKERNILGGLKALFLKM